MSRFPETLAAIKTVETNTWGVADALVAEIGEGYGLGLHEATKELADHGFIYSKKYLSKVRLTALAFPKQSRFPDLAFNCHMEAGNPETLAVIVQAAKMSDSKVTISYVRTALTEVRERERKQREQAKIDKDQALARKKDASARFRTLQTGEERDKAREDLHQAKSDVKDAAKRIHAATINRTPPELSTIQHMVIRSEMVKHAMAAQRLAIATKKLLDEYGDVVSITALESVNEAALATANAWNEVTTSLRGRIPNNTRRHLFAVNE